ncbi:MAG: hypothetical protein P4M11_07435 [Candidatus Pacebacteria bacterium]|nr:hypothetical protein [Candidatus Paceibacterota bacterium]
MVLRTAIAIVLILIVGYGLKEAWPLLSGPQISLTSPENGGIFYNGFISISGDAVHTQSVSLDGGPLLTDPQGRFSETIVLPPGGAILTITATDRFGRTTTTRRTVFVP